MHFHVVLDRKAEKVFLRLNHKDSLAVSRVIDSFENDPWSGNVKKITGTDLYHVKVRESRIIYSIDNKNGEVYIEKIARRNEQTYKNL